MVSMYSYAPLRRSGSASPRSVLSAEITIRHRPSTTVTHRRGLRTICTVIRRREVVLEHRVDDRLDVCGLRVASAVVDLGLAGELVRRVACLKDVERATHVSLGKLEQRLLALCRQFHAGEASW